jgi:ADP-heptose:LPS heptosyltransferase
MTPVSRAILFRVGGLGDLLVALPSVSLVRRSLPDSRLTLVGRPEYARLLKQAGIVDEVEAFDDPGMAAVFARDDARVRSRAEAGEERAAGVASLAGFDLALGWLNRRGEWPAEEWWRRQGIGRAFFAFHESGAAAPMSRFFFDRTREFFALSHPDDQFDECARLTLGRGLVERALDSLGLRPLGAAGRRLVVHPGSGGRAKRWPLRNFMAIVEQAAARGLEGVLVTGEAEADIESEIRRTALPAGWSRAACLDAETLAGLLAGSTHYVGNDSGPTHLAAACGASVIAIFRDASLPDWRPFGRARVLSAPAVEQVPLEAVRAALDDSLGA